MNDFDSWNQLKQKIHNKKKAPYFREGQVWWIHVGLNIGSEIYGKGKYFLRPCLIFKNTTYHKALVIPLSTKKSKQRTDRFFMNQKWQYPIFTEIRSIDTKRLFKKMGSLKQQEFNHLRKTCEKQIYAPHENIRGGTTKGKY